jgi:hypothetical protein
MTQRRNGATHSIQFAEANVVSPECDIGTTRASQRAIAPHNHDKNNIN